MFNINRRQQLRPTSDEWLLRAEYPLQNCLRDVASCLRLTRALCAETHEAWLEDNRYINMDLLREERKEQLRKAA